MHTDGNQDYDLELQETGREASIRTTTTASDADHSTEQSPMRLHFHRMRQYFNILDRGFGYRRMGNHSTARDLPAPPQTSASNETHTTTTDILGQGNDGVFSNLSAKPESSYDRRERLVQLFHQQLQLNRDAGSGLGDVSSTTAPGVYNINQLYEQISSGSVPNQQLQPGARENDDGEVERLDKPPSYDEAHTDDAPAYWDLSPEGSLYYDEICVLGLPAGSILNFLWNGIVSASFQFFGFLITYILHTSHAAKEGSRCGLGITFLTLGMRIMPNNVASKVGKGKEIPRLQSLNPFNHDLKVFYKGSDTNDLEVVSDFENKDLLREKLETHTLLQNIGAATTTTTLQPTSVSTSGSLFNFYHHNDDPFDKAQLVMPDSFESHLSHGSEEKYDNNRNVTFMKILSIFMLVAGCIVILQSFYQYYKIKMMEKKLISQQERIDDLRDVYYRNRESAET